jgi:hypothetical protein
MVIRKNTYDKKTICFSIAFIILSGIVTNVLTFKFNGYDINALVTTNSSSLSSNTKPNINGSDKDNNKTVSSSKQIQQQLSSAPHTREYTLIAENTTL